MLNQVLVDTVEAYAAAILELLPDTAPPLDSTEIEMIERGHLVWLIDSMSESSLHDDHINELSKNSAQLTAHFEVLQNAIDDSREQNWEGSVAELTPILWRCKSNYTCSCIPAPMHISIPSSSVHS